MKRSRLVLVSGMVLAGGAVSLVTFALYAKTLAPTLIPYETPMLQDSAMLQMQACVLGITHPTGYPTWTMVTHLLTHIPLGDCAYRTNLTSAIYAALAVAVVYALGILLSRRVIAALVGALAFGLGPTLWSQAVIAEVYTLNALLVALTLSMLLLWREKGGNDGYLLLSGLLAGLSMTGHLTSALLLPAALVFVALVDWRKLIRWRLMLGSVGMVLLGLSAYLYLPIRASMHPPMYANNPDNLARFWYVVSGGNLRSTLFSYGPAELSHRVAFYWAHLLDNFNLGLLVVAVVGFGALVLWDRAAAALTGLLFFGLGFYAIENNISDIEVYFIPTYLVVSMWVSRGADVALEEAESLTSRFRSSARVAVSTILFVALLLLPLVGVGETYGENDMSGDHRGRRIVETVAENAAPNSTVLHRRSNLWYMVLVDRERRDLTLVDPFGHNPDVGYADIVWPGRMTLARMDDRYGTDDPTGVEAARRASRHGKVYLLTWRQADPRPFHAAGFRTNHVEGPLYELVPPDR